MMHVVKAQEGGLRSVRTLGAIRHPTPQYFGVETERAFEVRDQDSHMSDALQLDTHRSVPPSWSRASHTMGGHLHVGATAPRHHHDRTISCRRWPSGSLK